MSAQVLTRDQMIHLIGIALYSNGGRILVPFPINGKQCRVDNKLCLYDESGKVRTLFNLTATLKEHAQELGIQLT